MKENIKKLENAYYSIILLIAILGFIALIISLSAYFTGLTPRDTVQPKNALFNIIFYPALFIVLSFIASYTDRPKGCDREAFKFFPSILALFRISKDNKIDGACKGLETRYISPALSVLILIAAFLSYLCLYSFEVNILSNIYFVIWQVIVVIAIFALIIAIRHTYVRIKIKKL